VKVSLLQIDRETKHSMFLAMIMVSIFCSVPMGLIFSLAYSMDCEHIGDAWKPSCLITKTNGFYLPLIVFTMLGVSVIGWLLSFPKKVMIDGVES